MIRSARRLVKKGASIVYRENRGILSPAKNLEKKDAKKCWQKAGDVVLYLSAKAAGKNDFWKRQKQSERTNMDTLKNEPQVRKARKASEKSAWQKITSVVK